VKERPDVKIVGAHPKPVPLAVVEGPPPTIETARPGECDERLVSFLAPTSYEAEQYHGLCHDLEQLRRTRGHGVFAVTSPSRGDGKTTTALNLAGAMAQNPAARVLLVDADLRLPAVGTRLGLERADGVGLADAILDGSWEMEAAVQRCPYSRLSVLPAGQYPGLTYELLQSPRVGELLKTARQSYDYVLLDTPPLLLVPDCRILEKWVDGLLLVVAAHRTPRKMVEEALNALDPAKLIGLVFNGDDGLLSDYGGYGYGYGRARRARQGGWWRSLWDRGRSRPEGWR
jgi:capsular exopolysaccharide synthesis family protein